MDKIRSSSTSSPQVSIQAQQKSDFAEASNSTHPSLRQLPNEVQNAILDCMDENNALNYGATCKYYDELTQGHKKIWFSDSASTLTHPSEVARIPETFRSRKQSVDPTWREIWLVSTFCERIFAKILEVAQTIHEKNLLESAGILVSVMKSLDKKDLGFFQDAANHLLGLSVKVASLLDDAHQNDAELFMLTTTAFFSKPGHIIRQEVWVSAMNFCLREAQFQADYNFRAMAHAVKNAEFFALTANEPIPQAKLVGIAYTSLSRSLGMIQSLGPEKALEHLEHFLIVASKRDNPVFNETRQKMAALCMEQAKNQIRVIDNPNCAIDAITSVVIASLLQPSSEQTNFYAHLNDVKKAFSGAQERARSILTLDGRALVKSIEQEAVKLTADGIKQSLQNLRTLNPIVASLYKFLGHFDTLPS